MLRAGNYNAAKPVWRGVIREDSSPWYTCTHDGHRSPAEAAVATGLVDSFKVTTVSSV